MNDFAIIVVCVVKWLLWKTAYANTCSATPYQIPSHVLVDHVIQSFHGTSSAVSCFDKCGGNSSCHSINWYSTGLCQLNSGTHLSYPEGLVSNWTGRYMLYSLHPMVTCSNKFCSDPDICLTKNDGIEYQCQTCGQALGMQDGRIKEVQITASSNYNSKHRSHFGRLHVQYTYGVNAGGWVAYTTAKSGEYLQVDLLNEHIISKVATQGRNAKERWVKKYYLKYSHDGVNWKSYKYGGSVKEFVGNTDSDTVVTRKLPLSIKARFLRVVVLDREPLRASMRMELYGCIAN